MLHGVTMHADQLEVTDDMVRALIGEQFPQWGRLPIKQVPTTGTVNALFRIGDGLVARFRLRPGDAESTRQSLESEAEVTRELLSATRFPTPEPVAVGEPGAGFPLPWSVQTWLTGIPVSSVDLNDSVAFANDLAEFIRGVRAMDTHGRTFPGPGRGGNLRHHDDWMETCFHNSEQILDVPRLRRLWKTFRDLPPSSSAETMNHGDLIPGNLLACQDHLAGIIDVGGLGPADPALDLVSAWHLFDNIPRQALRDELGCGDLEWERGKAWAFEQAMGLVWYYNDSNPAMSRMGRCTLIRIVTETTV